MWGLRYSAAFAVLGGALVCASCGPLLLPAAGPNAFAIDAGQAWNGPPYGLVKLNPKIVNILDGAVKDIEAS